MYKLVYSKSSDLSNPYPTVKSFNVNEKEKYFTTSDNVGLLSFDNIIENAPVFDYFKLWDITNNKENDWILLDAYHNGDVAVEGWLISEKLKFFLENFKIAKPFKFYLSKLMFQGSKLDYYIFQMAWNEWSEFDFEKSSYYEKKNNEWIKLDIEITNPKEFRKIYKLWDAYNEKYKLKLVLKKRYDLFYFQYIGFVASEEFKIKLDKNKITGLESNTYTNIEFEYLQ